MISKLKENISLVKELTILFIVTSSLSLSCKISALHEHIAVNNS